MRADSKKGNPTPRTRRQAIGLAGGLVLTLASGWLHGEMQTSNDVAARFDQAADRMARLPSQFGAWQQESELKLGKSALELLACHGYIHRAYRHRDTGQVVRVALMVGPGTNMSIHVPEICYESKNFTLLEERRQIEIAEPLGEAAFWGVVFRTNDVNQQQLRVVYGWSDGGEWVAPRFPRWSVAARPVLYKMQLSSAATPGQGPTERGVVEQFLTDFLPLVRQIVLHDSDSARDVARSSTT